MEECQISPNPWPPRLCPRAETLPPVSGFFQPNLTYHLDANIFSLFLLELSLQCCSACGGNSSEISKTKFYGMYILPQLKKKSPKGHRMRGGVARVMSQSVGSASQGRGVGSAVAVCPLCFLLSFPALSSARAACRPCLLFKNNSRVSSRGGGAASLVSQAVS